MKIDIIIMVVWYIWDILRCHKLIFKILDFLFGKSYKKFIVR